MKNKNNQAPDGGINQNVFDIMQGASINIFVKKQNGNSYGKNQCKRNGNNSI